MGPEPSASGAGVATAKLRTGIPGLPRPSGAVSRVTLINRSITRELGFNWQALGAGNNWVFGLRTGLAAASFISPLLPLGALIPNAPAANSIGGGYSSGKWDVNGVIDALAADQLITLLAEPNLTAQSGETASFLAGGEFPIPVAGTGNGNSTTITVVFKQYGVSLAFVPTVIGSDRINLKVRPEVSQLSSVGAVNVPVAGGNLQIDPGSTPTRKVELPMMMMVTRKVYFRPTMSPMRPNTSAPNGRTRKPAANARSAKMVRVVSSNWLKNLAPMTAASEPYR